MMMHTPPENQGQIVEVSYGWTDGALYQRVYDHSDWSESWYRADEEQSNALPESYHPVNGGPDINEWAPCTRPVAD